MRQISDTLLLDEIKALIESKKTPLTKEEIINWTYDQENLDILCLSSLQTLIRTTEDSKKKMNLKEKISERNSRRYREIRNLINALEDINFTE